MLNTCLICMSMLSQAMSETIDTSDTKLITKENAPNRRWQNEVDWSVGAGVSFLSPFPSGLFSTEHRVDSNTWIFVDGNFDYQRQNGPVRNINLSSSYPTTRTIESWSLNAATGFRHLLMTNEIELSWFWGARGGAGSSSTESDTATHWSLGAVTGIAVERELMSSLSLRFSSTIAHLDWVHEQYLTTSNVKTTLLAGIQLNPNVQLRLYF